ncbi:hypothetical protein ACC703_25620 [Rhizobium ruizarguesonis]|nr:hypothetical protein G7039_08695 [Rhizobium leguminosarum]
MPNAFAFRLKPSHIDHVEELLAVNQIAIGWSDAKGLEDPSLTMADFRTEIAKRYPEIVKRNRVGHDVGHLWRFIRQLKVGDIVVVPHGDNIHFLQVASGAKYLSTKVADDTAYRRDAYALLEGPVLRSSLPTRLRSALKFRDTSINLAGVLDDVLSVTGFPVPPLTAVESSADVTTGLELWRTAFEKVSPETGRPSPDRLWVSDPGVWLKASVTQADGQHAYQNELGNIEAGGERPHRVVMVNLADGGKPGRFQGLIATTNDGQTWLLHSGELNLERKKVVHLRDHISNAQLSPRPVKFSDGSVKSYYPVARLDRLAGLDVAVAMDVVLQSKRFMDVCLQVRNKHLGVDHKVSHAQRKAGLFEETLGHSFVPAQAPKFIDRVHAKIWHALAKELYAQGFSISNQRVGALGPDLFTTRTTTPYLFEIKTNFGASDYLKGIGQLLVYEKALGEIHRKFLVLPAGIGALAARILGELDIEILEYLDTAEGVAFEWPEQF